MEEIADEVEETERRFAALAALHDEATRGNRPSPDLGSQLRKTEDAKRDPNFEHHLSQFLKAGAAERPDSELPTILRMERYAESARVKRQAAKEIRPKNPKIAQSLEEIADLIEESTEHFAVLAANMAAMRADALPHSPRYIDN